LGIRDDVGVAVFSKPSDLIERLVDGDASVSEDALGESNNLTSFWEEAIESFRSGLEARDESCEEDRERLPVF